MPLPNQRRTRSSAKRRASHFALKATGLTMCPQCKKPVRPHRVCASCGKYRGRQHIKVA
ncbi:MAG: 50S ribosomal protein L32 [Candidatus Magasanikbacteria bacterium]|nr:50S ribosomal protein L32 [Candidatus Magasanikbacteria bacterium]